MSAATCSTFIIIFMFFGSSISTLFIEKTQFRNLNISSLERFAFYYKNHTYMIHSDAFGVMNLAEIVDMLPTYQMVGTNNTLIKPGAKNTVNIFFIQNLSAIKSFSYTLKVFNDDGCNLFLAAQTFQEICSLEQVKLAPASFVFNVKNDELFSCFTENEDLGLTLVPMEKFNSLEIYHRSFGDLEGKTMKVYFLNSQSALCRGFENGIVIKVMEGICEPTGAEANLVRVLGKKFNFTPEFWVFEYENAENMLSEMISSIGRGNAELGIGTITLEDDGLVYYTTFTQISAEFVILFVNPTKQLNLGKILISFDFIVYVIAVVSFILIVILKIVFTNVFSYGVEKRHFIIILLKMVVEQGSDLTSQLYSSITMKLLLSLWLYFTIIFCTVLKSQISSILIKPETYDCRSVEDLKRNDFDFAILDRFQNNFNARYGWMGVNIVPLGERHFEDVREICPQTMNFFDLKVALVHSEFDLLVGVKMCMNYFPQHKMNDMKMLKESNIYHALAMNPLSPYKKQFSLNIDRLKSSGILTYWYDYLNENVLKQLTKVHAPPRPFEINQVFNFFILLMVGLLIGFLVLILEIIEAALDRRHKINFIIMERL